jgi:hypothetical protein
MIDIFALVLVLGNSVCISFQRASCPEQRWQSSSVRSHSCHRHSRTCCQSVRVHEECDVGTAQVVGCPSIAVHRRTPPPLPSVRLTTHEMHPCTPLCSSDEHGAITSCSGSFHTSARPLRPATAPAFECVFFFTVFHSEYFPCCAGSVGALGCDHTGLHLWFLGPCQTCV